MNKYITPNNFNSPGLLLRRFMYIGAGLIDSLFNHKSHVSVLCYHSLASDNWRFSLNLPDFKKQLEFLKKNYQIVSLDEVYLHLTGKKKITKPSVAITFDDGYADLLATVDFFKAEKISPAIFVLSSPHQADRNELDNVAPLLNTAQIKKLHASGWTVGCHTATHPDLSRLSKDQIKKEIVTAKKDLESSLGFPVDYLAYPKGIYNQDVLDCVSIANYKLAFSMDSETIGPLTDSRRVPRVGVDRSHSQTEFKFIFSPLSVKLRKILSATPAIKLI